MMLEGRMIEGKMKLLRERDPAGRVFRIEDVPPSAKALRDERDERRNFVRHQRKRIKKLKRRPGRPGRPKKHIFNFKINGQNEDEARLYHQAILNFLADEKLYEESCEFSDSDDDFGEKEKRRKWEGGSGGKVKSTDINDFVIRRKGRKKNFPPNDMKRKRKRSESIETRDWEVSFHGAEKWPIKDCSVVLTRLLSSEILDKLNPCPKISGENSAMKSGKCYRTPKRVAEKDSAQGVTEEDEYVLDEENIIKFFSTLDASPPYSSSFPTVISDEDEGPPRLSPAIYEPISWLDPQLREDLICPILEREDLPCPVLKKGQSGPPLREITSKELVAAIGKQSTVFEPVCFDWNHSSVPSTVKADKLSDSQWIAVTAVNKLWDKIGNPTPKQQQTLDNSKVRSTDLPMECRVPCTEVMPIECKIRSSDWSSGINLALKVSASYSSSNERPHLQGCSSMKDVRIEVAVNNQIFNCVQAKEI